MRHSASRAKTAVAVDPRADFYAIDNSLLRSKSTGIHLRTKTTMLENDLSTPLIKWGTIIRGIECEPYAKAEAEAKEADRRLMEAGLSLRDEYGRTVPVLEEPREWLIVKGIRNLRGRTDSVTRLWYIPCDIAGAPILLKMDDVQSDEEDTEEDATAKKWMDLLPDPTDSPPFELGTGMEYEVIAEQVIVRAGPSMGATPMSREWKGAVVEMFDWNETMQWRQVLDKNARVGWMLLDHPELGPLLRPKCLPFQVRPVEPMCAAVLEADLYLLRLRQFINKGFSVNVKDAGDRTPLMLAAEFGRHGPAVVLCAAGADAAPKSCKGGTAVDMANSEVTKALIQALADEPFDHELCQEAINGLQGEVKELADDLLRRKMAKMKFFQAGQPGPLAPDQRRRT